MTEMERSVSYFFRLQLFLGFLLTPANETGTHDHG